MATDINNPFKNGIFEKFRELTNKAKEEVEKGNFVKADKLLEEANKFERILDEYDNTH